MKKVRSLFARLFIRAAMKTCVQGFCYDHLVEAHIAEGRDP